MVRGFTVCGVPGAKPRAVLPNSVQFDAASGEKMAADCRFRSFRSTMLHLRARGFAPVTRPRRKSLIYLSMLQRLISSSFLQRTPGAAISAELAHVGTSRRLIRA